MRIMEYINNLPNPTKHALDFTAVATGLLSGIGTFLSLIQTPVAVLASLAALVYTVMRIVQLRKEMNKGK